MKAGNEAVFKSREDRDTFGEGPFKIQEVNTVGKTVKLADIGSVAMEDILVLDDYKDEESQGGAEEKEVDQGSSDGTLVLEREEVARIESVCGHLLSHSDPNVKFSVREVLRIVWQHDKS